MRSPQLPHHPYTIPYRPKADVRIWLSLLVASICGTACGDWLANDAGFGLLQGLGIFVTLLCLLAALVRGTTISRAALYWMAIVLTRGAATNLADLATHRSGVGYGGVLCILALALLGVLAISRGWSSSTGYWPAILLASTLGTASGDGIADGLGLGVWPGSACMTLVLGAVLSIGWASAKGYGTAYWLGIVAVRSDGTMLSDGLSHLPGIGHATCAVVAAVLLPATLLIAAPRRRDQCASRASLEGALRMSSSGPQ